MVQAMINISKHTNHILNIIKAKYELKNKSEAIDLMAERYEEEIMEPELRPEYVRKMEKVGKEKVIHVGSVAELNERYE
jgi:hypothetical protein